ncbi:uncharacterized protein LOC118749365 [Rhagoletis pomonella]|uniref:uncharacterized protein LOC118749365 n=1 Tax=Rhagoletis pomonella TaxID=28610 RepID=UPI001786E047|nr:uncharacterized protein LOC118749365 [Rhagoletis pomonella]
MLKLKQQNHHDEADMAYESKKHDKELSSKDKSIKMYTFDLQQCLPTPHLNAAMFFYKRPLWTFNFTMHDGATNRANCYICPGQNRNSYIFAMFEKVLEDHQTIELIDHKFLVVGHTHMECDTVHSQIEKKKKKFVNSIHHPHDWATLIVTTNHKYNAIEMVQDQYFDFGSLLKNKYTWRNTNTLGDKFEWKLIRWMRYEKSKSGILQYKLSLQPDEDFKELDITQQRRKITNFELKKCYSAPLPISCNKKPDLQSVLPFINAEFHNFYNNLHVEGEEQLEDDWDIDEYD